MPSRLPAFFFSPISAQGFGLMRVAWANVTLLFLLFQWKDIPLFYSDAGFFPSSLLETFTRPQWRFSLLDEMTDPSLVFALYVLLLLSLALMMIGWKVRLTTIVSVVLLFSFHERTTFVLGGGDTVLRSIGFLLAIAPDISAFSIDRLRVQWKHWRKEKALLRAPAMPIWPYRLLLWQFIVLYGMSLWNKLLGITWMAGTSTAITLHHPTFARWPIPLMRLVAIPSPFITYAVLIFHTCWLFLLIPSRIRAQYLGIPESFPLKRLLLLGGLFFHGGIFALMDAGSFSLALFAGYFGLLLQEDLDAIRKFFNRWWNTRSRKTPEGRKSNTPSPSIFVFYDGKCGICSRLTFFLFLSNWLTRLTFVNYHDAKARKAAAPQLKFEDLDHIIHMLFPDGRVYTGFDGFRAISHHLPPLWPLVPFLHLPGATFIGRKVYTRVSATRREHHSCKL